MAARALGRVVRPQLTGLLVLIALLASAAPVAAQDALVLSGGGARGLAHAGALLELEAHGYDPELVVGASMGAVIGSLYAAGYTPAEIVAIVEGVDWNQIFAPQVAVVGPDQAPRYPVLRLSRFPDGPFSFRHIVPDWRINRLLVRTLYPPLAEARSDFDRLPRRFRAVAADLSDLELVAPAAGNLPLLVRASLSAPAFFAPVRWRDRWLLDGGARDYLPVALARELGAERVVAVDVVRPPDTLTSLGASDVAQRTVRLLLQQARADAPATPDLLILPDLPPDLSAAIFPADPAPLIRAGARGAARALAAAPLATRSVDSGPTPPEPGSAPGTRPADAPPPPTADAPPPPRGAPPPAAIDRLVIDAPAPLDRLTRRLFEPLLRRYDAAAVLAAVDRLYATGLVDGVWPVLLEEAGEVVLRVRADPAGTAAIEGALAYDSDRGARGWSRAAMLLAPGGWPAVASAAASLSRDRGWGTLGLALPAPARPDVQLRIAGHGQRAVVRLPLDDAEVWRAGGWIGGDWRHTGSGVLAAARLTAEQVDGPSGSGFSVGPALRLQRLDPLVRPAGIAPLLAGELRFGSVAYRRIEAGASLPVALGPLTVAPLLHAAATGGAPPADALPGLGDGRLVPAVEPDVGRGRTRLIAGVDLAWTLPYEATLRLRSRTGVARQVEGPDGRVWRTGSGLSLLWWTPFGQVEMGVEAELEGNTRFLLQLGPDW